jgi:ComF family protein
LCPECVAKLPRLAFPFCRTCGEPFPGNIDDAFDCPNCSSLALSFDFARPALVRDSGALTLIHRLKYQREIHLADELGRLAAEALNDPRFSEALKQRWPLIPVPLFRHRLRHRHFNQSEEIARAVAGVSGLPLVSALRRIRATGTQTALSRKQRLANLKDAFALNRTGQRLAEAPPPGAILVDDVLTTGSTLDACARILHSNAKIPVVAAITVMRG